MFRSRIFWRLYASYAVLLVATAGAVGWLLQQPSRQRLLAAALATLFALLAAALIARRFARPIVEMVRVAEALREKRYDARVRVRDDDELGALGDALNRLAEELRDRDRRLSDQGARLDALVGGMREGVVALTCTGEVAFSNPPAKRMLGLEVSAAPEAVGEVLAALPPVASLLRQAHEDTAAGRCELTLGETDAQRVLEVRATPFGETTAPGTLLLLYDLSPLRRLERMRTDFVANVSHELKTPLTSIQGYVETLLDGAVHDTDHNVRFLQKIEQHVGRLAALVSDLLSLARIESPEVERAAEITDWREPVGESVARRRDTIDAKGLTLRLDLGEEPLPVRGAAEDLRQIADNLLDNAINYTPAGGVITVRLTRAGEHARLEVGDTGIGIPREALGRIFERFYRVDRGRSRELGGTGLGLSIVRNLVHHLGGRVSVDSRVGRGSTFTVELPVAAA